ncbi:MAG: hypothetical protein DRJ10_08365, partial [Bacteroidetes bacterium]
RHKKLLYYMDLTNNISYKKMNDTLGFEILKEFYKKANSLNVQKREKFFSTYWNNFTLTKSTFMKFRVFKERVLIDIYRDDSRGGEYKLEKTINLNL